MIVVFLICFVLVITNNFTNGFFTSFSYVVNSFFPGIFVQPTIDTFVTYAILLGKCCDPLPRSGLCQYLLPDLLRDDFSLHAIPLSSVRILTYLSQTPLALYGVPVIYKIISLNLKLIRQFHGIAKNV